MDAEYWALKLKSKHINESCTYENVKMDDTIEFDRNRYEYKGAGLRVTNISGENEREQSLDML